MTYDHYGSIVVFSPKIAVEQAGHKAGMSPSKARIVVMNPASLYTVGMHHEDTSLRPWLRKFTNPWHTGSECPIITAEAFGLAIVQEADRNIAHSGCCNVPFRWTNLNDGSRGAARLDKSLIN